MTERALLPRLIVIASTYPRWKDDHEPSFVHELTRRMTSAFDVVVICPHAAGAAACEQLDGVRVERFRYAPERFETLVNDGGIVSNLRRSRWKWLLVPGFIFMQWSAARRHLTRDSVIHAHWIITPGLVARFLKAPFLVTSHGADLFALRGAIPMAIKRTILRRCAAMTVVSHSMIDEARPLLGGRDAIVSPMGVDLHDRFVPDERVTREYGRILFVGRLVEKKGVEVLLQAMPSVLVVMPHARLTIIGFGPLERALREECSRLGLDSFVEFKGAITQACLPEYYRAASVFVAPFRSAPSGDREGLGLVLVEALGCGCPVVTSDVPAVQDVALGQPGVHCVAPGDPDELAERIVDVLSYYDVETMKSARALLVEKFDWYAVANRYAALLGKSVGHKVPPA